DDNEVNQIAAVRMLEKLEIQADVASDGVQAVAACQRSKYDMVLMDGEMPEMDGFEATAEIRRFEAKNRRPRVPIIAVTANAIRGEREKCLAAGRDDYMAKPVRFAPLREMVTRWANVSVPEEETPAMDFRVIDEIQGIDP